MQTTVTKQLWPSAPAPAAPAAAADKVFARAVATALPLCADQLRERVMAWPYSQLTKQHAQR